VTRESLVGAFAAGGGRFLRAFASWWIGDSTSAETPGDAIFQASRERTDGVQRVARGFWSQNVKYVLIASIVVIGEGVVWYSGQFGRCIYPAGAEAESSTRPTSPGSAADRHGHRSSFSAGSRTKSAEANHFGRILPGPSPTTALSWCSACRQPASINYRCRFLMSRSWSASGHGIRPDRRSSRVLPGAHRYCRVGAVSQSGTAWAAELVPVITTGGVRDAQTAGLSMSQSLGHALIYPITCRPSRSCSDCS